MARAPRKFSTPFWITFAALVPACGGTAVSGDEQDNGGTGGDPSGTGGRVGSDGGSPGVGGMTTNPPYVPCDVGELLYPSKECAPGASCYLETLTCTDAVPRTFLFQCVEGEFDLVEPLACPSTPYAQCRGPSDTGALVGCEQDHWRLLPGDELNPPGPCPIEQPAVGDDCSPGGFGEDPPACGYPCGDGDWIVMNCHAAQGGASGEFPPPASAWESKGCGAPGGSSND